MSKPDRPDRADASGPAPTPILFIIFKRADPTRRVFEAIRQQRPARLFIAADAARPDRPGEAEAVQAARAVVAQIDWPCEVLRDYAETNLGCARRVDSAITWAFTSTERLIILEDDCLPDPSFFPFCDELLERYAKEERIAAICGMHELPEPTALPESYYFSRYANCWGWATWRRAWAAQDLAMKAWPGIRDTPWLETLFERAAPAKVWRELLDRTCRGEIDSWAYPWNFNCWLAGRLSVHCAKNSVLNLGFGEDATHTRSENAPADNAPEAIDFPLRHPADIQRNARLDERAFVALYRPWSVARKIRHRLFAALRLGVRKDRRENREIVKL
jgi:hypothetical protein